MKKHNILIFFLSMLVFCLQAQSTHTLSAKRNAYRAVDRLIKQQVEYKDPGSKGKDLIWDFRMVQPINEEYKLNYFIPDSTRMERLCGLEHRTRYYYLQHADTLWTTGFENATTYMEYIQSELKLKFPFSYGDTLFSYFEGKGEYCHRDSLHVQGYTRVEADAKGELQLPDFETVKNALRVHTLRHYTQTGKDSLEMILDIYSWYANGVRYPVFESIKTTLSKKLPSAGGEVDTTVFTTSFYYPPEEQISQVETEPLPTETNEELSGAAAVFTEATLLPNPVTDKLYLNYKLTRPAQVWFSVHSNGGIPLCQTPVQNLPEGYNSTTIDMRTLITGTYTLYVHVDDMVLQRIVVKK